MAAAGCSEVALGAESGSDAMLTSLNKRFVANGVRQVSDSLGAAGIRRTGFLLLGGPGETRDTVRESIDLAASLGLEVVKITVGVRIYPATPLARQAVAEGVVAADDDLLRPRFYCTPGTEEWVEEALAGTSWEGTLCV